MARTRDVNTMMRHVFIQWMSMEGHLESWMDQTINWSDETGEQLENLDFDPVNIIDTFEWDDEWVEINDDWVYFCDRYRSKVGEIMTLENLRHVRV